MPHPIAINEEDLYKPQLIWGNFNSLFHSNHKGKPNKKLDAAQIAEIQPYLDAAKDYCTNRYHLNTNWYKSHNITLESHLYSSIAKTAWDAYKHQYGYSFKEGVITKKSNPDAWALEKLRP